MDPHDNDRPPLSRRVKLIAAAVLGLTLLALFADRRRDRTGTLLVQADAGEVSVTILRDGRPVIARSDRRSFDLTPGSYEVLATGPDSAWRVTPARVSISGRGRAVVRVERRSPAP